ncbi:LysR family transcriptional regulator [Rhodopila sp.]|uniref:LysR family transcriptional regulator n=1 Tax=Rhodopila sp. TaxID=2480087 RepID=UPI003D0FC022
MKARINIGPAELETFLVIAELGSFSKAADRLALAQPSISNRVQRLERAMRTRLFERTTRAVVLTPSGERLRSRVGPLIQQLQDVIEEFSADADARNRSVVVATTPMLATVLLPPIITSFERQNPAICVELEDKVTPQLASDIRSGRVDFAVVAQRPPTEGIEFEIVAADRLMVVGPRGHKALASGSVPVDELARHPFLLLAAYKALIGPLVAKAAGEGLDLSPVRTVTNVSTLLGLVSAGLGLTLLPGLVLRIGGLIDDSRLEIATLEGTVLTRDWGIASLAGHDWSPGAKAFAAALRAALRAHSASGPVHELV